MDSEMVRELEERLDAAIADVLEVHYPGRPVSPRTTHLMSKAAVTVLEAVAEKPEPDAPGARR